MKNPRTIVISILICIFIAIIAILFTLHPKGTQRIAPRGPKSAVEITDKNIAKSIAINDNKDFK